LIALNLTFNRLPILMKASQGSGGVGGTGDGGDGDDGGALVSSSPRRYSPRLGLGPRILNTAAMNSNKEMDLND
jgi:hypothetical protein